MPTMTATTTLLLFLAILTSALSDTSCQWTATTSPPPTRWMSAAATSLGDSVAFCGGTFLTPNGAFGATRNQATTYNPTTDTWATLPNMTRRSAPGAGVWNNRLYVFAGSYKKPNASHSDPDPTVTLALVESIGIHKDGTATETHWTHESPLPFGPRESPSAVTVPGVGIVIGGGFNSGSVNGSFTFQYFNDSYLFNGATYTRLPDMPFARSNMDYVATKAGLVYAFGGGGTEPSYSTCAFLDVSSSLVGKKWNTCPTLVDARSWSAAGVVQGTIVLAGGMNGKFSPTSEVDMLAFDSANASWTGSNGACDLPSKAAFLSGGVTSSGVFVVVAGYAPVNSAWVFSME